MKEKEKKKEKEKEKERESDCSVFVRFELKISHLMPSSPFVQNSQS